MKQPIHPVVALENARRALECLSAQMLNPSPEMTKEYTVECAKALQAASYTLFNIAQKAAK